MIVRTFPLGVLLLLQLGCKSVPDVAESRRDYLQARQAGRKESARRALGRWIDGVVHRIDRGESWHEASETNLDKRQSTAASFLGMLGYDRGLRNLLLTAKPLLDLDAVQWEAASQEAISSFTNQKSHVLSWAPGYTSEVPDARNRVVIYRKLAQLGDELDHELDLIGLQEKIRAGSATQQEIDRLLALGSV